MSRQKRYGKLIRGWDFRTYPELLRNAEKAANKVGMSKTEFIEFALKEAVDDILTEQEQEQE